MSYATDYELAQDADFVARVTVAMVQAAIDISNESVEMAGHLARVSTAQIVAANPAHWGRVFAIGVAAGGAVALESTDSDIFNRIATIWNTYVGRT